MRERSRVALVTGATGFVGSHLVETLLSRGWRVRCLVRRSSVLRWLPVDDVSLIDADISSPGEDLDRARRGSTRRGRDSREEERSLVRQTRWSSNGSSGVDPFKLIAVMLDNERRDKSFVRPSGETGVIFRVQSERLPIRPRPESFLLISPVGRTRTGIAFATSSSGWRVCQFHHVGKL